MSCSIEAQVCSNDQGMIFFSMIASTFEVQLHSRKRHRAACHACSASPILFGPVRGEVKLKLAVLSIRSSRVENVIVPEGSGDHTSRGYLSLVVPSVYFGSSKGPDDQRTN